MFVPFLPWWTGPVVSTPPKVDNGKRGKSKRRAAGKRARAARKANR